MNSSSNQITQKSGMHNPNCWVNANAFMGRRSTFVKNAEHPYVQGEANLMDQVATIVGREIAALGQAKCHAWSDFWFWKVLQRGFASIGRSIQEIAFLVQPWWEKCWKVSGNKDALATCPDGRFFCRVMKLNCVRNTVQESWKDIMEMNRPWISFPVHIFNGDAVIHAAASRANVSKNRKYVSALSLLVAIFFNSSTILGLEIRNLTLRPRSWSIWI